MLKAEEGHFRDLIMIKNYKNIASLKISRIDASLYLHSYLHKLDSFKVNWFSYSMCLI